jgi:hypothetical protein
MEDHEVRVVGERPHEVLLLDQDAHRAVRLAIVGLAPRRSIAVLRRQIQLADSGRREERAVGELGARVDLVAGRRVLGGALAASALVSVERSGHDAGEGAGVVDRVRAEPQSASHHVFVAGAERVFERRRARNEVVSHEAVVGDGEPDQVVVGDLEPVDDRVGQHRRGNGRVRRLALEPIRRRGGLHRDQRQHQDPDPSHLRLW